MAKEEAIQTQDVDTPEGEEAIQTEDVESSQQEEPIDFREGLVAKHREVRAEEVKANPAIVIGAELPTQEQPVEEAPEESPDDPVELKVEGEVVVKTRKEVEAAGGVDALQKRLAADHRLEAAAKERLQNEQAEEELRRKEQDIIERERSLDERLTQLEKGKQAETVEVNDEDLDTAVDTFVESVYDGKADEGKQALKKVLSTVKSAPQASVDTEQVVKSATAQAVFESERQLGKRAFAQQYPHLSNDPNMLSMVNRETKRLYDANPESSPYDIILDAAANIDEWAKGVRGDEPEPEVEDPKIDEELRAREETKQQNVTVPRAQQRVNIQEGYVAKKPEQIMDEYHSKRAR